MYLVVAASILAAMKTEMKSIKNFERDSSKPIQPPPPSTRQNSELHRYIA
jgi:hypothetical protein